MWRLMCGAVVAGGGLVVGWGLCRWGVHPGVVWWVWGRVCGRGGLDSGEGDVGWREWAGVMWCGEVDGGRCVCGVR